MITSMDVEGELSGAMLNGLVVALTNVHVLSKEEAQEALDGVNASDWYPMTRCADVFRRLERFDHDVQPVLYRAGFNFAEEWLLKGVDDGQACGGTAFLEFQTGAAGYASAVRGDPERVGWAKLIHFDPRRCFGVIESANPFPREFERGIWMAGLLTPGDMDWAEVAIQEDPFGELYRRSVTVEYRKKPLPAVEAEVRAAVHARDYTGLSAEATEALLWKYRRKVDAYEEDRQFCRVSQHLWNLALARLADVSSELALLASTDVLTGLSNRRKIFELGNVEADLLQRLPFPLSVVMVDIDHFKQVNDCYGHRSGDHVIKAVAAALSSGVRKTDHVGRIGGEEFLLLLPNTPASGAHALAESLRSKVAALRMEEDGRPVAVTISLGCATTTACLPFDQLVAQADAALYTSKLLGRNRTTCSNRPARLGKDQTDDGREWQLRS